MKKGIAFAGNIIVDRITMIDFYPAPQTLANIQGVSLTSGGLVCNCLRCLAKLDASVPLKAIGVVGRDEMGDYLIKELAQHGRVDLSAVSREGTTSYTDVMTDPRGNRTFFQYRGANALFSPRHIDMSSLEADILHIGYILLLDAMDGPDPDYPTALCRVLDEAQKKGIATSIDIVSEDSGRFSTIVPPALAYTDYCVINEIEAERTTGIELRDKSSGALIAKNLPKACAALKELGVRRWIVIHTPECSCGFSDGEGFTLMKSWDIPEGFKKSSVGAGDAFAAALLYGAYSGWSLKRSIDAAGAVAAYSLSGVGATDSIRPIGEILDEMKTYQESENREIIL